MTNANIRNINLSTDNPSKKTLLLSKHKKLKIIIYSSIELLFFQ